MVNSYVTSYLTHGSMLGFALDRAGLWHGEGWYVQVNMHGSGFDGSTDRYLGLFTNKSAADAAGKAEIERQEKSTTHGRIH